MRNKKRYSGLFANTVTLLALGTLISFQSVAQVGNRGKTRSASAARNNLSKPKTPAAADEEIYQVVPQKCVPIKEKEEFVWNFEDEQLHKVLRQVSDLLCRTIVINDSVNQNLKLTIIGKTPLTVKDAWNVLLASLERKGLTLVQQGNTWTVIKTAESKTFPTPMYRSASQAADNQGIGTYFYKTKHTVPDELKTIARALTSKSGTVETIGDQFIIIIDTNSNIKRLGSIFAQIDVEDAINKIQIIPLENADAKTVEKHLRELFDVSSTSARSRTSRRRSASSKSDNTKLDISKIIAIEASNKLIVVGDDESLKKLREVVAMLDEPASGGKQGKINVIRLAYGDSKEIADTLKSVVEQGRSRSRFSRRRTEETNEIFEGEVKVTAHEATNTLVIVASPSDYRFLKQTIAALDVRKEQVYVEAVIMDIDVSGKSDFGINLFSGIEQAIPGMSNPALGVIGNPGGGEIAKGISASLSGTGSSAITSIPALGNHSVGALAVMANFLNGGVFGLAGPAIPGTQIPSFGAVIKALSSSSNVDVLSTPYLLTTDNKEAVMSVGQKIPVVRGASSVGGQGIAGIGGVPLQNISHEDVKLTFKITPHVGADNNVRLDVEQEVDELGGKEVILGQDQYRIKTKSAKTTIVLKDQQTGVIGGLISHSLSTSDQKVPFLGDIPILGWLFKTRHKETERKSLLLVLTPYIIRTDADYKKILERKLKEREEFARLYYGGKIKNYNKYVDYDKKTGPLGSMISTMESEMVKAGNGGPGATNEIIIAPTGSAIEKSQPNEDSQTSGNMSIEMGAKEGFNDQVTSIDLPNMKRSNNSYENITAEKSFNDANLNDSEIELHSGDESEYEEL